LPPHPAPRIDGEAQLRPTLFLGVGGLAGATLRGLRRRLHHRFGSLAAVPALRLLLVDTDRAALQRAQQGEPGEALSPDETLLLPLRPANDYRDQARDLLRWLDRRWLYGVPRSLQTEGLRPLGRLALVDNAADVLARLRETLAALRSPEAIAATASAVGAPLRTEMPRVFLVTSVAGGTGGGMLIDLAYAVRHLLEEAHLPGEALCGVLLHATSQRPASRDLARINAYATLQELHHFSRPDTPYPGEPSRGLAAFGPGVPPLGDCYLLHLGDGLDEAGAHAATDAVAEYLQLDAATAAGAFFDQYRQRTQPAAGSHAEEPTLRSFGLYRISFPRYRLAAAAADHLCLHLLDRWRGAAADRAGERHELGALPRVCSDDLGAEPLTKQLQEAGRAVWGEEPGAVFRRLLADSPLLSGPPPESPAAASNLRAQVLALIDDLVGSGGDAEPEGGPAEPAFVTALRAHAEEHAAALNRALTTWLVGMVEDPAKRLKGADRAGRWLGQRLVCEREILRTHFDQVRGQRAVLRHQLAGRSGKTGSGVRWLGLRRGPEELTLAQSFLDYCWLRFQECTLANGLLVLGTVEAHLAEFVQELGRCRQQLGQCAQRFQAALAAPKAPAPPTPIPNMVELFPDRINSLARAAEAVFEQLGPDRLRQFEQRIQAEVLDRHGGLWGLTAGPADLTAGLRDELRPRAEAVVREALGHLDAAALFLESQPETAQLEKTLAAHMQAAVPRLQAAGGWQHLVLSLPGSPAGAALGDLVTRALPHVPTTVLNAADDVIVCREAAHLPVTEVAAALTDRESSYAETAARALTRLDVAWAPLTAGEPS
jgi:hypothetical protein